MFIWHQLSIVHIGVKDNLQNTDNKIIAAVYSINHFI